MRYEHIFILAWLYFLLHPKTPHTDAEDTTNEYSRGCSHLHCESGSRCIKRRFWCKRPPCPGMLYCSKSRKEALKGPSTCETVRCNWGHVCVVKVRECHWDKTMSMCKQQTARCISEKEYYEDAASCAGFECPSGKRCILRELHCLNPPCKLIRSCAEILEAHAWFDECRSLNCTSEYECFLRRPDNDCFQSQCTHTPDCVSENELLSKYCRGWICPRKQKCTVHIVGLCHGYNCTIKRSCRASSDSSSKNNEIVKKSTSRSILTRGSMRTKMTSQQMRTSSVMEKESRATMQRQSGHSSRTFNQHEAEISLTQQRLVTKSNVIAGSSMSNGLRSTISYSPFLMDHDKLSTSVSVPKITSDLSDSSKNSAFWTTLLGDRKIESTTSRDANVLKVLKKFYITRDDALPVLLEGINLVGQGYPIWIKDVPSYPSAKNGNGAGYHAPQEPYRILLPPYEPVFLVEDTRNRGQIFPFFTYTFDYPFDEEAFVSLPEITAKDIIEDSRIDDTPIIIDKTGNHVDISTIVKTENFMTSNFDDSFSDYTNSLTTEKTSALPSNIRDEQPDNYYDNYDWQPWYVIHDYIEPDESRQESRANEFLTNDFDASGRIVLAST